MNIQDLKQIDQIIAKRLKNVATKDDLKRELKNYPTTVYLNQQFKKFATKDDLKNFATKDDLKQELKKYATKDDLQQELQKYATKDDLRNGLIKLENQLQLKIDEAVTDIIEMVDKHKADKKEVNDLEIRVSKIEEELSIAS